MRGAGDVRMLGLQEAFDDVATLTPGAFEALGAHLQDGWVVEALAAREAALEAGGEAVTQVRGRKLPLDRLMWLVIGMALFRDRSIEEVAAHLELVLPAGGRRGTVARSSLAQGRKRLGAAALWHLFALSARVWSAPRGPEERWHGLTLRAVDGTVLNVPDTRENAEAFGRPGGTAEGGYPQVRVLALMSLTTHVLCALEMGGCREGELSVARALWEKLEDDSVTVLDRGFVCWGALWLLMQGGQGRHFCVRQKAGLTLHVVGRLGRGDAVVEVRPSADARRKYPALPEAFCVRRVACAPRGYRPFHVLTSLLDAQAFPAREFAALYRTRWEVETGYDEVKTHLLERQEALRSRTPEGVAQEVAGIALAYNLVRVEMARLGAAHNVAPTRLSFRHSLLLIRNFCLGVWATRPGAIPRRLERVESDLRLLLLPPKRGERRYKREVKRMTTSYTRKKPAKSASAA